MKSLNGRKYRIKKYLGGGSYGAVYKAYDNSNQMNVALKFVGEVDSDREARILQALQNREYTEENYTVRLLDQFSIEKNQVYVQELLYSDLCGALKMKFRDGFDLQTIASIGLQLCKALCQFNNMTWKDKNGTTLIHGDLKLDNVMFVDKSCTSIKIVDFGTAFFLHENRFVSTQTRNERAPESLFNETTRQTPAVDMWSVGVMLFTLFQRGHMFNSLSDEEQMANLVYAFGEPPIRMMENKDRLTKYFKITGDELSLRSFYKNIASQKYSFGEMFERAAASQIHEEMRATVWMENFKDLLLKMFELDPILRVKPDEAIRHPFFQLSYIELHKKKSSTNIFKMLKRLFGNKF